MKLGRYKVRVAPDPAAAILGTGYQRFYCACGVDGLWKLSPKRVSLLAVDAKQPGTGQFRIFIHTLKKLFPTIEVLHVHNALLRHILTKYGFTTFTATRQGEIIVGFVWKREVSENHGLVTTGV